MLSNSSSDRSAQPSGLLDLPSRANARGPTLAPGPPSCLTRMVPHSIALDAKGRLFVFGQNCEPGQRAPDAVYDGGRIPMVEWFAKGKKKGTLVELPPVEPKVERYENPNVLEEARNSVVFSFSSTSRRLRFDGAVFSLEDGKGPPLWRVTRTAKGTVWALTTENRVVRRAPGGEWEEVPLPRPPSPPCHDSHCYYSLLETVGDDVFLADEGTLYKLNGPVRDPLPQVRFPTFEERERAAAAARAPSRAVDKPCSE